jgi:hypothetical protein
MENNTEQIVEKKSDLNTRCGKIEISMMFFQEADESMLKALFSNFFPFEVLKHDMFKQTLTYIGYSPHFDVCEATMRAPQYVFWFERREEGTVFSKVVKSDVDSE